MSQETRQLSNRAQVADYFRKAAALTERAAKDSYKAHEYINKALALAEMGDKLANAQPAGYKPLPAPIRAKTLRGATMLRRLADEIAATPVTRGEAVLSKRKKQEARTA